MHLDGMISESYEKLRASRRSPSIVSIPRLFRFFDDKTSGVKR